MQQNYDSAFWKNLGDEYVERERYAFATYCYGVALQYNPDNRSVYNNLGYTYQMMGNEQGARNVKKKLEELTERENRGEARSKKSIFDDPLLLFFIFFGVVWGLLFFYWYKMSVGFEVVIGAAMAGLVAFIVTCWVWAFFFLWDSDNIFARIIALPITGIIGGVLLLLFRTLYSRIQNIQ
jgi:tetratricopeptide (TPR) repeat protein